MTHDNPYIPKPAIPVDESYKEIERERILKEDFKNTRLNTLNSGNTEFVLPGENDVKKVGSRVF